MTKPSKFWGVNCCLLELIELEERKPVSESSKLTYCRLTIRTFCWTVFSQSIFAIHFQEQFHYSRLFTSRFVDKQRKTSLVVEHRFNSLDVLATRPQSKQNLMTRREKKSDKLSKQVSANGVSEDWVNYAMNFLSKLELLIELSNEPGKFTRGKWKQTQFYRISICLLQIAKKFIWIHAQFVLRCLWNLYRLIKFV
jgi:hypothetical protein